MDAMNMKAGTIRQIHRALVANGYHISENALRQWVRCGQIPSAHSGNTSYICYGQVINHLTNRQTLSA